MTVTTTPIETQDVEPERIVLHEVYMLLAIARTIPPMIRRLLAALLLVVTATACDDGSLMVDGVCMAGTTDAEGRGVPCQTP